MHLFFYPRRVPSARLCFLTIALAAARLSGAQQNADWLGGPGDWSDPTQWSTGVVPNNSGLDTYAVFIDHGLAAASSVSLNADVTIDALSLDADDSLSILTDASLTFDAAAASVLENNGLIGLQSGGLSVLEGDLSLSGGGEVALSDSSDNVINGAGTAPRLINEDNTITGAGAIGQDSLAIVNRGTISATNATPLVIDPNASGVTNSGVLEAREGGHLTLTGGSFVNSEGGQDGTILADGSLVEITHPTANVVSVNGGDIRVEGAGELRLTRATITGSSVENSSTGIIRASGMAPSTINASLNNPSGGLIIVDDRSNLRFSSTGTYTNEGEIHIQALTGTTTLQVDITTTIGGTGKILLGPHTSSRIFGSLINEGNTIEGAGSIVAGIVTNRGTIRANQPTLLLDSSAGLTNSGMVEAVNGGWAQLPSSIMNSENGVDGTIRAGSGSKAILRHVTGGNVEALDGGIIERQGGGLFSGVKLHVHDGGVIETTSWWWTIDGTQFTIDSGGRINAGDSGEGWTMFAPASNVNNGVIKLGSPTARGVVTLRGPGAIDISGVGEIDMSANASNVLGVFVGPSITIGAGQAIRGAGTIGAITQYVLVNHGTITADQAAPMTIRIQNSVTGWEFDNYGQYIASGPGGLILAGNRFRSWGDILVLPGSQLSMPSLLSIYDGTLVVEGLVHTASTNPDHFPLRLEGGKLSGNGTIDCNVQNGGILTPGLSVGVLTVARRYVQTAPGELSIEIGGLIAGTEYDRLAVGGVATLNGTLRVEFVDGYEPNVGDTLTVMTYPSKVGQFSNMILPRAGRGKIVQVAVGETEVIVSIAAKAALIEARSEFEAFLDAFIP